MKRLHDNMHDLLTMSRSFGSFFLLLTQNMTTAVGDARLLRIVHTNIRWNFCLRGDPADAEFLAAALPVTGQKAKPRTSPFEESKLYALQDERRLLLEDIGRLPDRTGYLWFKSRNANAIKIRTPDLTIPNGQELEAATQSIRRDSTIGWRSSRRAYERQIADRDKRWQLQPGDLNQSLADAYQQARSPQNQRGKK
jgi:hypothetical protein